MPKKKTTRKKAATTSRKKTTTRAAASRTAKKAPAKKAATRKAPARTATARKAPAIKAADKPRTKSQIFTEIAGETGLSKKDVQAVFETMQTMIEKDLGNRGPGQFTVPGLLKITKKHVPRRPAQKNKWIPLVQEHRDIPARPAHNKVAVRALKNLKSMV
ncbi:MAG: HU family DNA-binding protein [Planctomycetota bacterium]|jgi:nucleoid DNA-binding protein